MSRVLERDLPARWGLFQRVKNTLIYITLRVAVWLTRAVPFVLLRPFAIALGHLAFLVDRQNRRRAEDNLAQALGEVDESGRRQIVRQMFVHLALCAIEVVHMRRFLEGKHALELCEESRAAIETALAAGHGVVAVGGHIGNWELFAQILSHSGYPITSIAKPLYDPRLTRWVNRFRTAWGHRILWRGDDGVPKKMLRVFREGGVLGMLIDQDTRVQGVFVPFFGRPAHTPTAAASLALRSGAAVVAGHTWRDKEGKHHVQLRRLPMPEGEGHDEKVAQLTARITAYLEEAIRQHPEQWVWLHDRWRRQPE